MRILVEIVHPADVLFFLRPIRAFQARGDEVLVASRRKDVACALLDRFGIAHTPISGAATGGLIGLGLELAQRDFALWRLVRRFRPHAMLGYGGVAISQIGKLTGAPALVWYASETASLQIRLVWPIATRLTVPADYAGPVPEARTRRLFGMKELSYFHPNGFRPDRAVAIAEGLDPGRSNVFLRLVSWKANHDVGKTGWSEAEAAALVAALAPRAKLHVSAEGDAPAALRPHLWRGDPANVHHLMAHCDVYAGESVTMAGEALAMGAPPIYAGADFPGYAKALAAQGLMTLAPPETRGALADLVLARLDDRSGFDDARSRWLAKAPDWAEEIVRATDEEARPTA